MNHNDIHEGFIIVQIVLVSMLRLVLAYVLFRPTVRQYYNISAL